MPKIKKICPICNKGKIVKKGKRKTKFGEKQIYLCKLCNKRFTELSQTKLSSKMYSPNIILAAISYYNLGNNLEESSKLVNRRFKVKTSPTILWRWVNEFKDSYSYHRLRNRILEKYKNEELLICNSFVHKGLTYNFKYHKAKLELFKGKYFALVEYLKNFEKGCPSKFFENEEDIRCSKIKINSNIIIKNEKIVTKILKIKKNYACKLAGLALKASKKNSERHSNVEEFMLINDSCSIACEVPIWFWEKSIGGICGHIDLLQLRYGKIYILDLKPDAASENIQKIVSQLYFYALGLGFRTGIPLQEFRCAWFDDENYFEFNPKEVRLRF